MKTEPGHDHSNEHYLYLGDYSSGNHPLTHVGCDFSIYNIVLSSFLSSKILLNPLHAKVLHIFPFEVYRHKSECIILYCKYLSTIIAITFEPFELFSCVTTHLKGRNPFYKDHIGFLSLAILEKWWVFPGRL